MITLKELHEAAYANEWKHIAEDSYSPVDVQASITITDDIPQYEPMIQASFVVEFWYSCTYREGESELAKKRLAIAMHHRIYGDIIDKLYKIQHSAYTDSREELMAKIDNLIKETKDE